MPPTKKTKTPTPKKPEQAAVQWTPMPGEWVLYGQSQTPVQVLGVYTYSDGREPAARLSDEMLMLCSKLTKTTAPALKQAEVAVPTTSAKTEPSKNGNGNSKGRAVRWHWHSKDNAFGILWIRDDHGKEYEYFAEQIALSLYRLTKLDADATVTYTVRLLKERNECGCTGHKKHGKCKHVDALLALRDLGNA